MTVFQPQPTLSTPVFFEDHTFLLLRSSHPSAQYRLRAPVRRISPADTLRTQTSRVRVVCHREKKSTGFTGPRRGWASRPTQRLTGLDTALLSESLLRPGDS
jgi:hypothetical protein